MPAAAIAIRAILRPNFDGSLRTTNPLGDYQPSPTLVVDKPAFATALGSLVGLLVGGTAVNFNLAGAWLTGTDSGIATFGIRTVTGDDVTARNWAISTTNLTQSLVSGSVGSGSIQIYALDSGLVQFDMGTYAWSIASGAGTDTLPPTIPTGLAITPASGALNCLIDPSSDRYDGATAPSGVDHYDVYADAVLNQHVGGVQSKQAQGGLTNLGAFSPTPTASDTTGVWTLTAAGTGIHNTPTEQCEFVGPAGAVTGDFVLTAKLDAFTSANANSTSGLMVRETMAQGAIFGAIYVQPSSPGNGLQVKRRATTGGNGTNAVTVAGITTTYARIVRSGTTFTFLHSSDGITFTSDSVQTLPMGATCFPGLFLASQTGGTTCTSTIREVNLTQTPSVSFSVSTAVARTITVKAIDAKGNVSAACTGVLGTPGGAQPGNVIKFHPGHYPCQGLGKFDTNFTAGHTNTMFSFMDSLQNDATIAGFQIDCYYATLDNGTSAPNYAVGEAFISAILARFASYPTKKRLILGLEDRTFGGSSGTARADRFPQWWINNGWVEVAPANTTFGSGGLGSIAKYYLSAVADAMIAAQQHFGALYNSHPLFEMISPLGESSVGGPPTGWSFTNANIQVERILNGTCAAWPNTLVRWRCNGWNGGNASLDDLFGRLLPNKNICYGGPDPEGPSIPPTRTVQANGVYINRSGSTTNRTGVNAWCAEVQTSGLGNGFTWTPQQIHTCAQGTVHNQYMVWLVNNGQAGGAPQQWSTGELPYIHSINGSIINTPPNNGGSFSTAN